MTNTGRRKFIKYMAVGTGITVSGLVGINSSGKVNYSHYAYQYWNKISKGALTNEHYLALCGSLAASAHNTQPWMFQLNENTLDVFADLNRNLGKADIDRRLMALSVGCAIENINVAGHHLGFSPEILLQDEKEFMNTGFAARIKLSPSKNITSIADSSRFNAIFSRQTTRNTYLDQPIDAEILSRLNQLNDFPDLQLTLIVDQTQRDQIRNIHAKAAESFVRDDHAYADSLNWWRYSREELLEKRDGISIHTSAAPNLIKQYFSYAITADDMKSDFGKNGELDLMLKLFSATPLWAVITASNPNLTSRLNGGRLLERLYLASAEMDYRIMPIAYATEQPLYAKELLKKIKIPTNHELLSVVRMGKSELLERSVRRQLSDIIV
jgi:hypothetical protein